MTAKYSFLYPKKDAKTVAKDLQTAAQTLSSSLGTFQADLSQCNAYNNWKSEVENDAKQALETPEMTMIQRVSILFSSEVTTNCRLGWQVIILVRATCRSFKVL